MKKILKWSGLILLLLLAVVLSVVRIRRVTDEYKLAVMPVHIETPVTMYGYTVQSNRAEVYTLERYYEKYPQVAYFEEMNKDNYQYVLMVWMQITKRKEDTQPLDLTDFVLRMGDSFQMIDPSELSVLNEWTENQHLEVDMPFYVKMPYYLSDLQFSEGQREKLEQMDYRVTWGVYPRRNELILNRIEGWEETIGESAGSVSEDEKTEKEKPLTGAEGYAKLLNEKGLTGANIRPVGETPVIDGIKYDVKSVKQIYNVSEIPDYSEEYQPQPEWMKEGADVPVYTEEWDFRGDYIAKHNYIMVQLEVTNTTEEETAANIYMTGIAYDPAFREDASIYWSFNGKDYSTGGAINYKDSYGSYVVLQPGESKTVYAVYDLFIDIDPTGENDVLEDGYPTGFVSKEEAVLTDSEPFYFYINAGLGGEMKWENKGITFVELDWRPEDGTEN